MIGTQLLNADPSKDKPDAGEWLETAAGILYVADNTVQFDDDSAHWHNGFCRLLEIPESTARRIIEQSVEFARSRYSSLLSALPAEKRAVCLTEAVDHIFKLRASYALEKQAPDSWGQTFDGHPPDYLYAGSISGNKDRTVVGNRESQFAWQLNATTGLPVDAASVIYDRSYYESPKHAHCGMRDYVRHDDWRMEKARRLMRTVLKGAGADAQEWLKAPGNVSVLDVGSALGYFRQAMGEIGFSHFGIDLSEDAIAIGRERFGFDTWQGTLYDLPELSKQHKGGFNIITMWDTIEHLDDPLSAVRLLREHLTPGGILVIRTPSLTAFEADILGDMYYSFKLDHIKYFSPKSLTAMMEQASLSKVYLETTSHLFRGLLGADYLFQMGIQLKGADIVALYKRT